MIEASTLDGYRNHLLLIESLARVASSACRANNASASLKDVGAAIEAITSDLVDVIEDMNAAIGSEEN